MSKQPKHKQPGFRAILDDLKKKPATDEDPDAWRERTPSWAFSRLDMSGCQWSWEHLDRETLMQVIDRLKAHESTPWKQVLQEKDGNGRRINGSIEVTHPKIDPDAKARLTTLGLGDFDAIYKFRVDGPGRVWGVRKDSVLHIVWWDPEHKVYPLE